jgi:acyl dehydratase
MTEGMAFDDFVDGFEHLTARRTVTEHDASVFITTFAFNTPMFLDHSYASDPRLHGGRIVPGLLVLSIAEGLSIGADLVKEQGLALLEYRLVMKKPVFVGDTLQVRITLESKKITSRPDRGVVTTRHGILNQTGDEVAVFFATRMVKSNAWSESSTIGKAP